MKKIDMSNNERLVMLGEALYVRDDKGWWRYRLGKQLGISRWDVYSWEHRKHKSGEPTDQLICRVMALAKAQRDKLQQAIDKCTMYPWIH